MLSKYKIIYLLLLLVLLVYGCNSEDKHEQALRLINHFKDNPSQLQEFQQKVIIPRGKDVFIYVLDSLQIVKDCTLVAN